MLRLYAAMLPRVEAQRKLDQIEVAQLASGMVPKEDARRRLRELKRQAEGPRRRVKPITPTRADLAQLGIPVNPPAKKKGGSV